MVEIPVVDTVVDVVEAPAVEVVVAADTGELHSM